MCISRENNSGTIYITNNSSLHSKTNKKKRKIIACMLYWIFGTCTNVYSTVARHATIIVNFCVPQPTAKEEESSRASSSSLRVG